jgi:hypothetical protein
MGGKPADRCRSEALFLTLNANNWVCDLAAISEVQETRLGLVLLTLPDQIEALSAVMTKAMADAQVKS